MMGKRIGSLFGVSAFSLIILIGIGMFEVGLCISPMANCTTETYLKLDDDGLSIEEIDEILLSIPKDYSDKTPIGRVSVAELLRLREPCSVSSKIYRISLIQEDHLGCPPKRTPEGEETDDEMRQKESEYHPNAGAVKFLRHYLPIWEASRREALNELYKQRLDKLTDEQRELIVGIVESRPWEKFVRRHSGAADDLIRQYKSDPTRSSLLKSACRQLEYQPSVVHDELAEDLSQMVLVCRDYLFFTRLNPLSMVRN